jgi:hypothetical protein
MEKAALGSGLSRNNIDALTIARLYFGELRA